MSIHTLLANQMIDLFLFVVVYLFAYELKSRSFTEESLGLYERLNQSRTCSVAIQSSELNQSLSHFTDECFKSKFSQSSLMVIYDAFVNSFLFQNQGRGSLASAQGDFWQEERMLKQSKFYQCYDELIYSLDSFQLSIVCFSHWLLKLRLL